MPTVSVDPRASVFGSTLPQPEAMGFKYTVSVYGRFALTDEAREWRVYWGGESVLKALYHLWLAKRAGFGCVKLECR